MKHAILPIFCGLVLTAISATGISHWWSVRELIAAYAPLPLPLPRPAPSVPGVAKSELVLPPQIPSPPATAVASTPGPPPEFYRDLIDEMKNLRNQNRDLRDQMAETNRDLMKLEFRVDTHSESFRPLPVSEERPDTTLEESNGVLPPLDDSLDLPSR